MTRFDTALVALFGLWWVISALGQRKCPRVSRIKANDVLHLIPSWRFFAPSPVRRDYHLEYRLKTLESETTRWRRIKFGCDRSFWCTVWNPQKRVRKAFTTSVRRITRLMRAYGFEVAARSLAYLHLLNYLQNRPAASKGSQLQFRIVATQDYADEVRSSLVFTSSWHLRNT
jgi:hypothetical protein